MNNTRCINCNLINWANAEICPKCKTPLDQNSKGNRRIPVADVAADQSFFGSLSTGMKVALGAGVLLFMVGLYFFTKPIDPLKPASQAQVKEQADSLAKQQAMTYGQQYAPEDLGVRPMDPATIEAAKTEEVTKLGDGEYTPPRSIEGSTVADWGGTPGTSSYWERVEKTSRLDYSSVKKLCNRTVYGAQTGVRYGKEDGEIVAIVTIDIDQECEGSGPISQRRGTTSIRRKYIWKDTGSGIHTWVFDPIGEMKKQRDKENLESQQAVKKIEEEAKDREERTKRHREMLRAKAANQNTAY